MEVLRQNKIDRDKKEMRHSSTRREEKCQYQIRVKMRQDENRLRQNQGKRLDKITQDEAKQEEKQR